MVVNIFFKTFPQFFEIRVECSFNSTGQLLYCKWKNKQPGNSTAFFVQQSKSEKLDITRKGCHLIIYVTSKRTFFLFEILLKIGSIEEMRTASGNKELPQTFFHNSLYL